MKMKVLVVCSYRDYVANGIAPFIKEQVDALRELGVVCEFYLIKGKGIIGYLNELPRLRKTIRQYKPDIIHAHFGLSGLLVNLATRHIPIVVTYHGSDINNPKAYRYSRLSLALSKWNIFVSEKQVESVKPKEKYSVIPCGVNIDLFKIADKQACRKVLGLEAKKKYVLFSKMFDDPVKNYPLARAAINILKAQLKEPVELMEFIGYSRERTMQLMNAVDAVIMTSISEGSPQFIKEAMACGCPIVSVDVGDVKERILGVDGCYVAQTREPQELSILLSLAINHGLTKGRDKLIADGFDNQTIAQQIIDVYNKVLSL